MTAAGDPPKPPEGEAGKAAQHLSRAEARATLRRRKAAEEAAARGEGKATPNLPAVAGAPAPREAAPATTGTPPAKALAKPTAKPPAEKGDPERAAPDKAPPARAALPARARPVMFGGGANENRRAAPSRAAAAAAAAALDAPLVPEEEEPDPLGIALGVLLRLASLAWLVAAVWVWGRLVGYVDGIIVPDWHDPGGPWLTTLTAAVVYPVVAVGLWLRGRWGIVLWAAAVAAEVALLVVSPALLPFGVLALVGNLVALAVAAGLRIARALRNRDS